MTLANGVLVLSVDLADGFLDVTDAAGQELLRNAESRARFLVGEQIVEARSSTAETWTWSAADYSDAFGEGGRADGHG